MVVYNVEFVIDSKVSGPDSIQNRIKECFSNSKITCLKVEDYGYFIEKDRLIALVKRIQDDLNEIQGIRR